jgi:hypothetical protein
MSSPGRIIGRRHQRLLPAYVVAVIVGIVGMHVLMQHCPTPAHTLPSASAAPQAAHHAGQHLTAVMVAAADVASSTKATNHSQGGLSDMFMLCAAMLLGAGAIVLMLFRRRVDRPLTLLPVIMSRWRPPLIVADTGPPATLAFTVIRC